MSSSASCAISGSGKRGCACIAAPTAGRTDPRSVARRPLPRLRHRTGHGVLRHLKRPAAPECASRTPCSAAPQPRRGSFFGFAPRNPKKTLTGDVLEIWYSTVKALSNPGSNQDLCMVDPSFCLGGANSAGFGWQNLTPLKVGLQWSATPAWIFRAGFNHADTVVRHDELLTNGGGAGWSWMFA